MKAAGAEDRGAAGWAGGADEGWEGVCSVSALAAWLPLPLFLSDGGLRVTRANAAFLALFGAGSPAEVEGRSLGAVAECLRTSESGACGAHPACVGCGWLAAARACEENGRGESEARILRRDGLAFDVAVTVRRAESGGHLVCALRDLYAPKRLRAMERSFFHDVTNLTAGIRGLCDMAEGQEGGMDAEMQGLARDGVAKLAEEIERLRTLRVAENGDLVPCLATVDPAELLTCLAACFADQADARRLVIAADAAGAPGAFETDRELSLLALGELVRNAVEATARGGRVALSCADEDGGVVFRVWSAAPLSEEVRAHLFERSFTTKGAGHGLGAYRAKLIVERYLGGTLTFESDEADGTTFSCRFPGASRGC